MNKGTCICTKTGHKLCRLKNGKVRFKKGSCTPGRRATRKRRRRVG